MGKVALAGNCAKEHEAAGGWHSPTKRLLVMGSSWCWRLNQPIQHRAGEGGLRPQRSRGVLRQQQPELPHRPGWGRGRSGPELRLGTGHSNTFTRAAAQSWTCHSCSCQPAACTLCSSFFMPLKHTYKGKTQYNANSCAQNPIHRTTICQTVRDKKHKRFSVSVEMKMNINLQSSTKTMGYKEIDITNSPYSIRLGSHLPQTATANLDLKDKSSCRRALPLSPPFDAST